MVRFSSTNLDRIEQVARQLGEMGLEEGKHFSVKMPEGGGVKSEYTTLRKSQRDHRGGQGEELLTLKGFEKEVEVGGRKYMVKVVGWSTELKESQSGKLLLKIKTAAEIDGVKSEYTTTYGRYGEDNEVKGRAYGREADAERYSALIKALTGREPRIIEKSDGTIEAVCGSAHLKGFMRYAELADAIEKWLEETGRR
jgi:hypothetical protein